MLCALRRMSSTQTIRCLIQTAVLCIGCLVFTGCETAYQYPRFPDQSKRVEDPTKARMYVIRPAKFWGAGGTIRYGSNRSEGVGPRMPGGLRMVGELGAGSYLCWEEAPGISRILAVEDEPESAFEINASADTVHYIRADVHSGWWRNRVVLKQITSAEGVALLKDCRPPRAYQQTAKQP